MAEPVAVIVTIEPREGRDEAAAVTHGLNELKGALGGLNGSSPWAVFAIDLEAREADLAEEVQALDEAEEEDAEDSPGIMERIAGAFSTNGDEGDDDAEASDS